MSEYTELPRSLQRQIDAAFDKARMLPADPVETGLVPPAAKRRRIEEEDEGEQTNYHDEDSDEGGGFLLDDDEQEPGGFEAPVVEKEEEDDMFPDTIGLSMIPAAVSPSPSLLSPSRCHLTNKCTQLQLLDLPPDDEDVLSAFKNAAGGWGVLNKGEQSVSRDEWREVTAILLQHRVPLSQNNDENDAARTTPESTRRRTKLVVGEEDSDPMALVESDVDVDSADEFRGDDDDDQDEAQLDNSSDEDYGAPARKPAPSTRRTRRRRPSSSSEEDMPTKLAPTPRQRTEARKTFQLFFPDSNDSELDSKRIMIKDLTRVSKVLGIKLKAEEVRLRLCDFQGERCIVLMRVL